VAQAAQESEGVDEEQHPCVEKTAAVQAEQAPEGNQPPGRMTA